MAIRCTSLGIAAAIAAVAGMASQANAGPSCNTGARYGAPAKVASKPAPPRVVQVSKVAPQQVAQVAANPAPAERPASAPKASVQQSEVQPLSASEPFKTGAARDSYEPVSAVAARLAAMAAQAAAAANATGGSGQ